MRFAADYSLDISEKVSAESDDRHETLDFYDIGIAEIVLLPTSMTCKSSFKGIVFSFKIWYKCYRYKT